MCISLELVFMRYCWILLMAIEHPPFQVAFVGERKDIGRGMGVRGGRMLEREMKGDGSAR